MENKSDPFCNKEPTPLDTSLVPLAVTGFTEINYTILPDYSSLSLSSRPVQSGQSSQKCSSSVGPRLCRWTERYKKENSRILLGDN